MTRSDATWNLPAARAAWPQAPGLSRWIERLRQQPGAFAVLGGVPAAVLAVRQFAAIFGHTAADWQRDLSGPVLEIFAALAWLFLGCSLAALGRRRHLSRPVWARTRLAAAVLSLTAMILGLAVAFQGLFSRWLTAALAFEPSPMRTTDAPACIAILLIALGAALFLARQVRTLALYTVLVLGSLGVAVLSIEHWILFTVVRGREPHTVLLSTGEALAVAMLAAGALCLRPREGVIRLLLSRSRAGMLARRLVPAGVVAVTLLGYLQLSAQQRWNFSSAWAVALAGMGVLIALLFISLRLAWVLEQSDLRRSTAECRLHEAVEESQKLLHETHRLAQVGHWEWIVASGRFTWSPELFHLTGRDPALLSPSFAEHAQFLSPESWCLLNEETERAAETRRECEIELEVLRPNDTSRWFVFRAVPEHDASGRLHRFYGTMQHVTERHLAEEARRESEVRFRQAVEYSAIGFAMRGLDGNWITVNRAFCEMLGYTEAELLEKTHLDVTHPDDLELDLIQTRRLARNDITHYHLEVRYLHKHGHVVRGLQSATLVRNAAGQPRYYLSQVQDITQRHEAEELLRCQQDQLARFVAETPAAVAMFDTEMCYMGASQRWLAAYAVEWPKIMGRCLYDVSYQMKDRWRETLERCLREETEANGEESFQQPDGANGWLRWEVRPWRRAQGGIGGLMIFTEDVTERRSAALRLKQSLDEKEVLLKEIHHRVKNNMQVICSLLQLQSSSLHDPADVAIMQDCQRRIHAMALVHDRLYRSGNFSTIDFGEHLRELATLLGHSQGDGGSVIEVRTECAFVEMDLDVAIPLGLVAAELIINAFKHAFRGRTQGTVTISLVRQPDGVELSIADDGVGVTPPATDTPPRSLGLRLVRTLARQLRAKFTSAPGNPGSVFTLHVTLPSTTQTS